MQVLVNGTVFNLPITISEVGGQQPPPPDTPPVTPPAPPAPPPPSSGDFDLDWTTFNSGATYPGPGQSIQASGDRGVAIRFVPTTTRGIVGLAGYGPGAQEQKEMFISFHPHDFVTPAGNQPDYFYRRKGTDLLYQWISIDGPHQGNEALLIPGRAYFLNVRPLSQQGEISFALGVSMQ